MTMAGASFGGKFWIRRQTGTTDQNAHRQLRRFSQRRSVVGEKLQHGRMIRKQSSGSPADTRHTRSLPSCHNRGRRAAGFEQQQIHAQRRNASVAMNVNTMPINTVAPMRTIPDDQQSPDTEPKMKCGAETRTERW
jgi:hypothetical protein